MGVVEQREEQIEKHAYSANKNIRETKYETGRQETKRKTKQSKKAKKRKGRYVERPEEVQTGTKGGQIGREPRDR